MATAARHSYSLSRMRETVFESMDERACFPTEPNESAKAIFSHHSSTGLISMSESQAIVWVAGENIPIKAVYRRAVFDCSRQSRLHCFMCIRELV